MEEHSSNVNGLYFNVNKKNVSPTFRVSKHPLSYTFFLFAFAFLDLNLFSEI